MYKINFNHLYYFLNIAKEGSIVKAAKKLNISQPALSHQLKLLEDDLGKKLFDRVGKRLIINQDGESVREYASKIFRHSEEMLQYLKTSHLNQITLIKIGIVPWIPNEEVFQLLKPLLTNQYIQIEMIQKDLESLTKDLQNHSIDIILCDSPYSGRSKKLIGNRLLVDPILCVSSVRLKGKFPESLKNKKLLNYPDSSLIADKVSTFLNNKKIEMQILGKFTDSSLLKLSCEKGIGIAFLPKNAVKQSLKEKKLFKVGELNNFKFSVWAITHRSLGEDSIIKKLLFKS